jgi:hypothetical protein
MGTQNVTIYRRDGESRSFCLIFDDPRRDPRRFVGYESGLRYMCFRMTPSEIETLKTLGITILSIEEDV